MRIALQGGKVILTSGKAGDQDCCCGDDCCDAFEFLVLTGYQYFPQCCAYLYWYDDNLGRAMAIPVGMTGGWPGLDSTYPSSDVTAVCGNAFYIDYLDAGEPAEHAHLTTTQRSVVMAYNGAIIEVFLGEDCCPSSIQVDNSAGFDPALDNIELRFGPAVVENIFDAVGEDLVICEPCNTGCDCTMSVQGRTGSGFVDNGATTEDWNVSDEFGGYWNLSENGTSGPERTDSISVGTVQCVSGQWAIGGTWRSTVNTYAEGLTGKSTSYDYEVSLVLDDDGCPMSITFGAFTESYGANGASSLTPINPPTVAFECNPLP